MSLFKSMLLVVLICCMGCSSNKEDVALQNFNAVLGAEKSAALDLAITDFEAFLKANYPEEDGIDDKTFAYLQDVANFLSRNPSPSLDSLWNFDDERNRSLIDAFEQSGLRKEIWLYGYEDYVVKHDFSEIIDTNAYHAPTGSFSMFFESDSTLQVEAAYNAKWRGRDYEQELQYLTKRRDRRRNSRYFNSGGDFLYGLIKYSEPSSFAHQISLDQMEIAGPPTDVLAQAFIVRNPDIVYWFDPFEKRLITVYIYFVTVNMKAETEQLK